MLFYTISLLFLSIIKILRCVSNVRKAGSISKCENHAKAMI
jgi:hypothetical protein